MHTTEKQLPFRAKFEVAITGSDRAFLQHTGWYIQFQNIRDACGVLMLSAADDEGLEDLYFLSQRDCELAIAALAREGITTDGQLEKLPGNELKRIAYSALPW